MARIAIGKTKMTTTAHKAKNEFTIRTLMALLALQARLAEIPGSKGCTLQGWDPPERWIQYPATCAQVEEEIATLIRRLAWAYGIPESYPPMG